VEFDAELWEYEGDAPWVFVTLPHDIADAIDDEWPRRPGFGSVPVVVTIGATEWRTSVFPDKGSASFVLPVKQAVRRAEGLEPGDTATVVIAIDADRP
jgi:hypothetical protein